MHAIVYRLKGRDSGTALSTFPRTDNRTILANTVVWSDHEKKLMKDGVLCGATSSLRPRRWRFSFENFILRIMSDVEMRRSTNHA